MMWDFSIVINYPIGNKKSLEENLQAFNFIK